MQQHNQHAQKGEGGVDISQPPSAILGDLSPVRRLHRKSTTTAAVSTSLCTPMTHQNQGLSKSTGSVSNNTSRKTAARPTSAISSRVVSATTSPTRAHNTTAARRRSTRPFVHRYHRRFVIPEDALAPTSIFSQQTASAKGQPRLETRFVSSQLTGDGLAKAERITQRDSRGRPTRLQGYITTGNPPPQSILDDDFRLGKRWDFHGARRGQGDSGLAGMVGEGGFVMRDPLRDDDSYFEMYRGEIEEQRAQEVLEEHERNRQEMIHHSPGTVKRRPPRGGGVGSMDSLIARNVAYLDADAVGAIDTNGELTHLTKYGVSAAVDDDTMEPTPLSRAAVIKRTVGIHDVSFGTVQSPTARSNYVVQLAESTRRQRSPGGMGGGGDVGKGAVVIPSLDGGDTGFMVPCALCNVVYSKQALKFRTTAKNIVRLHAEWEKQAEDEEYARRQASELSALMWNTTMMSTFSVDQSNVNSSAVSHVTSATGNSEIDVDVGYSTAVEEINNIVTVTSPEESVREAPSPTHHSPTNSDVGKLGLHRLAGLSKRISVSFLGTSTLAEENGGGVGGGAKKPVRAASVSFPGPTASSSKPPLYERQSTPMSPSPSSTVSNTHIKDANTAAGAAQKHNKASNMYAPVWVCTFCGQFFGLYEGMCGGPQTLEDVNAALIDECRHLKRNRVARVKQSRKENQALNSRLHKELDTLKKELAMREELAAKERHTQKQLTSTKCATSAASTGITRSSMPPGSPSLSVTIYGSVPDVGNLSLNREGADAFSSLNDQGSGAEGKQSASEEAVLSTLGLAGVVGGECTPVSLSTYPPLGDSSLGGAGSRGGGGGGVSPATNAMGVSMANRARGASMRGGGSSGRFKAVVKSVFETMTMLGKSARGDLDFTRIRGGTFGMVATSETPRAASASAGATTSMRQSQNEGADPNKLAGPKLLNEVERGALVEAFFTDGAPSMRMAISEPLSPPVSPRIGMSARGSSKAAKKWRRLSTTSRSRSQSLTSVAAVTPASQSPPDALSGAAPPAHTTAANTRSRSFSKASDDAPRNRVSREPTLVFIPPDHLTAMTSSSSPNINTIINDNDSDEDGALSIASNPSGVEGELNVHQGEEDIRPTHPTHNDVSLDATNPSSFATSALDATLNSATLAHSSSRKQQSSTTAGSVPSPNPRDPGRSAATSTVSRQANHLNLARKLLLPWATKKKSTTKSSKTDNTTQHPQPAPSFEKQCTMMRGKQQERNRIYIEQRTRRLDGSSSPPPLLHAPKRSASTTKRPTSVSVARPSSASRVPDTSLDASNGPRPRLGPESILLSPIIKRPTSHINTTANATTADSPSLSKQPPIVFEL